MKFLEVAHIFNQLEVESKRLEITKLLAHLFKQADAEEAAYISYLALGNVQAVYKGTQFNFAEKSMLHVVGELIDMSHDEVVKDAKKVGDIGAFFFERYRSQASQEDLSVRDVYNNLMLFLRLEGIGSQKNKEQFLIELLQKLDPASGKYVIRVVLGKLRLGFSDMTLLDAFSWMYAGDKSLRSVLEHAYNVSADIGRIIQVLKTDGVTGIEAIKIIPGIPILPAAAERLSDTQAIFEKLGPCVAQPKLDGFRLQVHLDYSQETPLVRFYSRNLQDMSEMFPDLYKAVLDFEITTLVAEGEAIAYDVDSGQFLPFQETVKRKRKHEINSVAQEYPLKLYFFDLLYIDGESYLDKSHEQRRSRIKKVIHNKELKEQSVVSLIEEKCITNAKDLEDYFHQNISQGLEGLVVKRTDALYQPGKRNFNWIKLKRQESGALDDTIDCVILGYYAGRGKRASFGIGALLVGVYDKDNDCFVTVAKIGTGLSDEQWRTQKKECDQIRVLEQPYNVECAKELFPDVWVSPEIVCMIRADEITKSPLHTAGKTDNEPGLALRFPRIMGYRPDKSVYEATTVKELQRLFKLQFDKKSP